MTGPNEAVRSDFDLLDAWGAGDASAGDVLARRHYGSVLRFFEVRTRSAEDLTQRTFLACIEARERFRREASFRTFLFSIARRFLMKHLAARQSADRFARMHDGAGPKTTLSALVSRRQEQQILLAALSVLPEQTQTLIVLHYWENLRSREIAAVLELPTSTVTTQLSRARKALAERVEQLAGDRAGSAILGDLEGWTRSIASPDELDGTTPDIAAAVGRLLRARRS